MGESERGCDVINLSGNCNRRSSLFDRGRNVSSPSSRGARVNYLGGLLVIPELLKLSLEFSEPGEAYQTRKPCA